jgi:hypothetical protein
VELLWKALTDHRSSTPSPIRMPEEYSMNDQAMDMVMQRLARLERAHRWWKLVGCVAVAALGCVILLGATKRQEVKIADQIWARTFVIADRNGQPRGGLTVDEERAGLQLTDQSGRTRLLVSVDEKSGPTIGLANENQPVTTITQQAFLMGRNGFAVQIAENGLPSFSLSDRSGNPRVTLAILPDGSPSIGLTDGAGKLMWHAP